MTRSDCMLNLRESTTFLSGCPGLVGFQMCHLTSSGQNEMRRHNLLLRNSTWMRFILRYKWSASFERYVVVFLRCEAGNVWSGSRGAWWLACHVQRRLFRVATNC